MKATKGIVIITALLLCGCASKTGTVWTKEKANAWFEEKGCPDVTTFQPTP